MKMFHYTLEPAFASLLAHLVAKAGVETALVGRDLALGVHEAACWWREGPKSGASCPDRGAHGVPLVTTHVLAAPILLWCLAELLTGGFDPVLALASGGLTVEGQGSRVRALVASW